MTQAQPQSRRRGVRCCCGCTIFGAALVVVAALAIWFGPTLLRQAGFLPPGAEELLSGAPDPVATEAMDEVLAESGVSGVEALVIPIAGSSDQLAIFSIDMDAASAGGIQTEEEAEAFLRDMLGQMVVQNQDKDLNIKHVALDFTGPDGESALTIAAPAGVLEAYAAGTITREEMLSQVDIDFSNLIDPAQLQDLLEEQP